MGIRTRHALRWGLTFGGAVLLFLVVALWQATAAAAATLTVNTATDNNVRDSTLSLREAILVVNGTLPVASLSAQEQAQVDLTSPLGTNDTINFNISGGGVQTITVGSALPNLARSMTIDGATQPGYPTTSDIVVDGNNQGSVFTVNSGVTATLNGLTIQHGSGVNNCGGPNCGGGINTGGTLTVMNCLITNNSVNGGDGGGIVNNGGMLTVTRSTFSGNSTAAGGGIKINRGTATITNSTFSGNSGSAEGGGIDNNGGTLTIANSTFSDNSAPSGTGGGISTFNGGTLALTNTIVANSPSGGDLLEEQPGQITGTNNLIDDAASAGGFTNGTNGNIVGSPPLLAPLGNYSGPTQTMALLPGSPAIDAGTNTGCPATDQRGVTRPQPAGGNCDIGAFESHGFALTPSGTPQSTALTTQFAQPLGVTVTANAASAPFNEPVNGGKITFTVFPNDSATATLTGSPATIASGAASVTATATGAPGQYGVQAMATGVASPANFVLTNIGACVVTSLQDVAEAGKVTLRDAVNALNVGGCTNNTVTFDSGVFPPTTPKTINVVSSPYEITFTGGPATIDGSGHMVVLDGGGISGFFFVDVNVIATINGLTMQHGASSDGGGAILNFGTLTVQNCTFDANNGFFASGGAIENLSNLAVINSTFTNNTAGDGGAIDSNNGTLAIIGSTFANNHSAASAPPPPTAPKSTTGKKISRPVRTDGFDTSGGALFLCSCSSPMIIVNSTFTGNTAATNGGAILTEAPLSIVNVTILGNSANSGGGIFVSAPDGGTLTATNDLIAGNTLTGSGGTGPDVNGTLTEASKNNLIGDGSTTGLTTGASGNQVGTTASPLNPLVGSLGTYGGPTQTIPLLPGSPAIDTGADTGCSVGPAPVKVGRQAPGPVDQRGVPRPQGLHCDIGAFESQGFILTPSGTPQSTPINTQFAQPLGVTVTPKNAGDPVAGGLITFTVTPAGSGASATLSTLLPVTINGSGVASVTATANGIVGSYTASASTAGAAPATFNLTNTKVLVSLVVTYNGSTTPTIKVGQVAPFVATATYSDGTHVDVTQEATWSSDNTTFATVMNAVGQPTNGQVTGQVPNGTVPLHITAVFGNLTGQATVTVAPPTGMAIVIPPAPGSRPSGATSGSGTTPNPAPSAAPPTQNGGTTGPAPAPVPGSR